MFRSIVCGTVIFVVVLYACTSFGSSLTQMATSIGYAIPEGAVEITGLSAGNWVSAVLFQIGKLIGG
jgi:Phosphotransferase system, galactitol-specific IIC component